MIVEVDVDLDVSALEFHSCIRSLLSLSQPTIDAAMNARTSTAAERNFALGVAPFVFSDLFDAMRLKDLFDVFVDSLRARDAALADRFVAYHQESITPQSAPIDSQLVIEVSRHLGNFVAQLFHAQDAFQALLDKSERERIIFAFKTEYIAKRVRKRAKSQTSPQSPERQHAYEFLAHRIAPIGDAELQAATVAMEILRIYQVLDQRPPATEHEIAAATARLAALNPHPVAYADAKAEALKLLEIVDEWHAVRLETPAYSEWLSYKTPHPIDSTHQNLVHLRRPNAAVPEAIQGPIELRRHRDGFALTDGRMSHRQVSAEVDYCLYCHERDKDSCSKGLLDKSGAYKKTPLGIELAGCPLEEKISEAHVVRNQGDAIGALAIICIDNPMCPGTGHRICNDCMKACIFQKQEPVNIPQAETGILTDVLQLPYGFEMYSLLTRWNPLNRARPYPLPYRGLNVLVVGMGPAGYTLSHYLCNEGFGVVGIDGLKIEPLPDDLLGADVWPPRAVREYHTIEEGLDTRVALGFGGVAEYGITVRWDKNFLKVIYLNLARRQHYKVYGGIRFGGTVTLEDAWKLGFHHVAIAAGAGKPTIVDMKNNLIRGVRKASDFLMGLQLSGAVKREALANMQVQLPAVVIGGGLTGVDTATELAAYYPIQIDKLLTRCEVLGEERVLKQLDEEERAIITRMLEHARELRAERARAALHSETPDIAGLVQRWGGVSLVYRRSLVESPAYRLNHEEVQKALEEGISIIENMAPVEAMPDRYGHVEAVRFSRGDGSDITLPARAVMVAAGTTPNTIYEKEFPGVLELDSKKRFFKSYKWDNGLVPAANHEDGFFTSYRGPQGELVSFYGDNHPRYAGNVVKAMASAKYGYPEVSRAIAEDSKLQHAANWDKHVGALNHLWTARVHQVLRLTPTIVEVIVHAPAQARKFEPGQFFRLQNFESRCQKIDGTSLAMEGLALTGAWVDEERGLLSMIALEMGTSSRLCASLRPGEPVVVMGPTGTPTEIPQGENVLLCGGGLGNAVLFSVAKALRANGNRVIYFAGYRRAADVFKREEVESSSDQVIWSVDAGDAIVPQRSQDRAFVGNIVAAMVAFAEGKLGHCEVPLNSVDRIIAIGSDRMMAAVTHARHHVLKPHLKRDHIAIASINSPMQCMMKEVCAQCLQRHVDPLTGAESFVFSCFNQDQLADHMDWNHLAARLKQNTVLEKVANSWLEHLCEKTNMERI